MMTTWVVLHTLPLSLGQNGPCEVVRASDVGIYDYDVESGQSTVKIVAGMTLCESVLLRGMLVHSAGDYAELLVHLTGMHEPTFVAAMNQYARVLGLRRTHYVDVTGISPGDVSTAQDQATLAAQLMTTEPIVRSIVDLPRTLLPVAGVVQSFTPLVGQAGVVGVKSGFTNEAGGCDVMAVQYHLSSTVITTYTVVLGAHGGDPLGVAGADALALSRSIRASIARVRTTTGLEIQWIGSPADLVTPAKTSKVHRRA
jgi:D-alanyl-D-alanine carboxypeptidase (penicillin-binding protein 5/6)